ncbi:predicted protein [Streptomyces sp. SPB78]|nr:predicted protein [Streptomyces sp. SPB78]
MKGPRDTGGMLSMALRLRDEKDMNLRDIAKRLVITGTEKGSTPHRPPSCRCGANTTKRRRH